MRKKLCTKFSPRGCGLFYGMVNVEKPSSQRGFSMTNADDVLSWFLALRVRPSAVAILKAVLEQMRDTGSGCAEFNLEQLARHSDVSRRCVRKYLDLLVKHNVITVSQDDLELRSHLMRISPAITGPRVAPPVWREKAATPTHGNCA
jgi:hypothetical protein